MKTEQIYELINLTNKEAFGSAAMTAKDTSSLVAMGKQVLSSDRNTEAFLNTLVQRIGKTIISYLAYNNTLKGLMMDDFQFGAIVQKIKVSMPEATIDPAYELEDGKSVDPWIVSKPKAKQKFYYKRTPALFFITIQQEPTLVEAFTDASKMGAFLAAVFGEVQNKLEVTAENLAKLTHANFVGQILRAGKSTQIYPLVTMYNTLVNAKSAITDKEALHNPDFARYAVSTMNIYAKRMRSMSDIYNTEGEVRHTPLSKQFMMINLDFSEHLKTLPMAASFDTQIAPDGNRFEIPYWQSAEPTKEMSIDIEVETEGESKERVQADNIVATIFAREALGSYQQYSAIRTTPENPRGLYYNTFFHQRNMWFNDMSENGIIFTLN